MRFRNILAAYINNHSRKGGLWSPFLILLMLVIQPAVAVDAFQVGQDYRVTSQPLSEAVLKSPVKVRQWFWYGCASCASFDEQYSQLKAPDVDWQRIPAQLRLNWYFHAKAFYVTSKLEGAEALDDALFDMLASEPGAISDQKSLIQWLVAQGIDAEAAEREVTSPIVNQQLNADERLQESIELRGVPTLVIDDYYIVDASMVRSLEQYMAVTEFLLVRARQARAEHGFEFIEDEAVELTVMTE